jgi:hypothetical protein
MILVYTIRLVSFYHFPFSAMRLSSSRPGEANVPAVLLSTAVLILSIAAAFYIMVILPFRGNDDVDTNGRSFSSTSSMMSSVAQNSSSSRMFDQAAYEGCLTASTEAHTLRWTTACLQHRETQESAYLACVNQGKGRDYCNGQFGGYQEIDANCVLPLDRTNALNLQFETSKEACDRQYGR